MLIVCPSCASEYRIDTDRVGPAGRSVRCAACRETWFIGPDDVAAARAAEIAEEFGLSPSAEAASPVPTAPAGFEALPSEDVPNAPAEDATVIDQPTPPRRGPRKPAGRTKSFRSRKGSTALLPRRLSPGLAAALAICALMPLAILGRNTVVRAMPQSAAVFARIGLPVNLRGIEIRDVHAFQTPAQGGAPAQLVIEGDLVGIARQRVDVPPIEIEIHDASGAPLHRWTVAPPRAGLEPQDFARFRATLSDPPAQGRRIEVRFAAAGASAEPAETATRTSAQPPAHH